MTKKIVCLLLAFVMLFSITACSGEDTEKIPDTSTQQGNNSQTPSDTTTLPTTGNEEEVELAPSALYMPIRLSKNDSIDSLMTFGYGAKEIAFTTGSIYFLAQDTENKTVKEFQISEGTYLIKNRFGRAELADVEKKNILIPTDYGMFQYPVSESLSHVYNPTGNYLCVFNNESDTISIYTQDILTGEQTTVVENKKIKIIANNSETDYEKIDTEKSMIYTDIIDIYTNEKESLIVITREGKVINLGEILSTFIIETSDNESVIISSPVGTEVAIGMTEYAIDNNGGILYSTNSNELIFYYANNEKTFLVNAPYESISNIEEIYSIEAEKILIRMNNNNIYRFTKEMNTGYTCVADSDLTNLYNDGHILEFATFAGDFIFLGTDHVVYETIVNRK